MQSTGYILRTDRLGLRELYRTSDLAALAEVFADPYARQFYPHHAQEEKLRRWIEWSQRNYRELGFGLWALEMRACGQFIGDAGLTLQSVEGRRMLEIGYHIHASRRGLGLATEAARACLRWAFHNTKHDTVCSIVHPENAASIRVAEKVHQSRRTFRAPSGTMLLFYSARCMGAEAAV